MISILLFPLLAILTLMTGWLAFLLLLAGLSRLVLTEKVSPHHLSTTPPFLAVLIPAHEEAQLISATVRSISASRYPPEAYSVTVVADNCTDGTAALAEKAGAVCLVRNDTERRGKGYALQYGLEKILADKKVTGVVLVDADTEMAPDFLTHMGRALERGAQVVQGRYRVANSGRTWLTRLTAISIDLKHLWQHPGMAKLGMSPALRGSGMCFSRAVLERFGWGSTSLTEDLDQSITFFEHGISIDYVPSAITDQYMPPTLSSATEQRRRWSAGEAEAGKTRFKEMLARAFRQGEYRKGMNLIYLMAPPFSLNLLVMVAAMLYAVLVSFLLGSALPVWAGLFLLVAHVGYFLLGASEVGFGATTFHALAMIPAYALWRVIIHAKAFFDSRKELDWKRTLRM